MHHRSCAVLHIRGLQEGSTVVTARFGTLLASVTIHVTNPLVVLYPPSYALVSYGASIVCLVSLMASIASLCPQTIRYRGGPAAHHGEENSHYESLTAERYDQLRIFEVPIGNSSVHKSFRVVCTAIGEQMLTLHVGNNATAQNPSPRAETVTIPFACLHPTDVGFWVSLPAAQHDREVCCWLPTPTLSDFFAEHHHGDVCR